MRHCEPPLRPMQFIGAIPYATSEIAVMKAMEIHRTSHSQ